MSELMSGNFRTDRKYPIFRDTCSWKGQLESFAEVGKSLAKLERTDQSWKEPSEVGKFELKLESSGWSWKVQLKMESDL